MTDKRAAAGYTINGLCELTGHDRRTVTNRLQGCEPVSGDAKTKKYLLRQYIEACENRIRAKLVKGDDGETLDPVYERARKDKELADRAALENRVRRDELLEADDVRRIWTDRISAAKGTLRTLPSKLAPLIAAESDPNLVSEMLMNGIDESLEELAE